MRGTLEASQLDVELFDRGFVRGGGFSHGFDDVAKPETVGSENRGGYSGNCKGQPRHAGKNPENDRGDPDHGTAQNPALLIDVALGDPCTAPCTLLGDDTDIVITAGTLALLHDDLRLAKENCSMWTPGMHTRAAFAGSTHIEHPQILGESLLDPSFGQNGPPPVHVRNDVEHQQHGDCDEYVSRKVHNANVSGNKGEVRTQITRVA